MDTKGSSVYRSVRDLDSEHLLGQCFKSGEGIQRKEGVQRNAKDKDGSTGEMLPSKEQLMAKKVAKEKRGSRNNRPPEKERVANASRRADRN